MEVEIMSCDRFGGDRFSHPNATITQGMRDELNQPGSFSFTIPASDYGYARGLLTPLSREVQVARAGDTKPLWWGVVDSASVTDLQTVEVRCVGIQSYFENLYVGRAQRVNHLFNASFDNGNLDGWEAVGVTAQAVDGWGALPGQTFQANLWQAGPGLDTFITQTAIVPGGVLWYVEGWFHLRADATWVGPALDGRGLYVERLEDNGAVSDISFFAITDDTPRGQFQRAACTIYTPPGKDWTLRVRCYATVCASPQVNPPGGIIWDDISLTAPESLSYTNQDVAVVFDGLTAHAQDPAFGKANLNIAGGSAGTGYRVDRYYQFADHENIGNAHNSFADQGLCDYGAEYISFTQRRFRCYAPQKGTVANFTIELGGLIVAVPTIDQSGSNTFTSVLVTSPDTSGPGADEASAIDASAVSGIIREEVIQPKTAIHHDLLALTARNELAAKRRVQLIPELLVDASLYGVIVVGDTVPVRIVPDNTALTITGNYRIVSTEFNPDTDQFRISLNAAS